MDSQQQHQSPAFRALQKKRTSNFREDETRLLIQLWGSAQVQNKLYLTHRKEPVMRLLAATMQQRGFYRTPDEIKTRIRNLKCLYHRIKRTVQSGSGIGTVDPDWPHYKAMDAVLNRQTALKKDTLYKDNVFEGPKCEDIKQEIEDIDINDDIESYTNNSMEGSEFDEEPATMPPLIPAPVKIEQPKTQLPKLLPNLSMQLSQNVASNVKQATTMPSIPFPLLILNSLQTNQSKATNERREATATTPTNKFPNTPDVEKILKEMLDVQKENLSVEKERLQMEKQRLEFERFMGAQLLAMGPVLGSIFHKLGQVEEEIDGNDNVSKDSKILKTLLTEGIRKYMHGTDDDSQVSDFSDK